MSYEDDRPIVLFDGDLAEETPFEAEQRRGRERMIAMWRAAVQCVTEAAAREASARASDEPVTPLDDEIELPSDAPAVDTWVFPAKAAAGN